MSVHGTAHWGERAEVIEAGLFGCESGLMVGWWFDGKPPFQPLRYDGDLHQLIVGGVGGGKFTTAIAPMLFGSDLENETVVVIDPKGEIAQTTGPFFQPAFADHPSVFVLDPWDEAKTGSTSVLNFIELLDESNPNYVDDARALADAMVLPSGAENTHWDNAARNFLSAVLLYVALDPRENGRRDLIRVREIVTLPFAMPKAYQGKKQDTLSELLYGSLDCELAAGAIKRAFRGLLNREERELSGIISSVERDTAWIDSPQMAKVLRGKSLDLQAAALNGGKYYIIIPPDFFMTHRYWLRLCVTAFAKAFRRYRPDTPRGAPRRWRHIVIDEFANLGEMNFILTDMALSRGYDVKYHLAIQDLSQLMRVYQQGWESFINNTFQRFFAVSDLYTANYVSGLIGITTAEGISSSESQSGSTAASRTITDGYSEGATVPAGTGFNSETFGKSTSVAQGTTETRGWSRSQTFTQVQRPLRTADEVRRLDNDFQFLLLRGELPMVTWRPPYWEVFPSLPDFSLKEVLGTIGRQPVDELEYIKFTKWREGPQLLEADRPPSLPLPLPLPSTKSGEWRYVRLAAIAVLLLLAWFELSSSPKEKGLALIRSEATRVSQSQAGRVDVLKLISEHAREQAAISTDEAVKKLMPVAQELKEGALKKIWKYPVALPAEVQTAAESSADSSTVGWLETWRKKFAEEMPRFADELSKKASDEISPLIEAARLDALENARQRLLTEFEAELSKTPKKDMPAKAEQLAAQLREQVESIAAAAAAAASADATPNKISAIRADISKAAQDAVESVSNRLKRNLEQIFVLLEEGVARRAEEAKKKPAPPPPKSSAAPKKTRPPVPSLSAALAMQRGPSSRDYFIQLIRDNANRCAIGHGLKEQTLMGHLLYFADEKRELVSAGGRLLVPDMKEYKSKLARFLSLPDWTRSDREQVLDIVLQALQHNGSLSVKEVLNRFYWIDRCPFDVISESEYLAPNYSDAFPPVGLR